MHNRVCMDRENINMDRFRDPNIFFHCFNLCIAIGYYLANLEMILDQDEWLDKCMRN